MLNTAKIIAISSSHRDRSNSEAMLKACVEEIEKNGIKVEFVVLRNLNFKFCDGCKDCDTNEKCHVKDSLTSIYPKLLNAEVWLISSPEYWWNISGLCKSFLDRLNAYWKVREKYFKGKSVAIFTCGGQPIERNHYAEDYLRLFFTKLYFNTIGSVRASAENPEDVLKQKETMEKCKELGKQIAESLKR
ncbi:MAG: flavodoxin family protein [Candidatus Micrarchaeota archaeon]